MADGVRPPRTPRRFSVHDLEQMFLAGVIGEDEHVEQVDGVLIEIPGEGTLDVDAVTTIHRVLLASLPADLYAHLRAPLSLTDFDQVEADIAVLSATLRAADLWGQQTQLVVEVGVTSLAHDLGEKALCYARAGVEELWVVDPVGRRIWVHREASPDGWLSVKAHRPGETVSPLCCPQCVCAVADLPAAQH